MHTRKQHCRETAYHTEDAETVLRPFKLRNRERLVFVCYFQALYCPPDNVVRIVFLKQELGTVEAGEMSDFDLFSCLCRQGHETICLFDPHGSHYE